MRSSDGRRGDYGGYGEYHSNRGGYYDDHRGVPHDSRIAGYDPHGGYPAPHGYDPTRRSNLNHYDQYGRPDQQYGGRTDLASTQEPNHRETRSRTPGPEFMRGTIADEDRYLQARTRELRSKTPTAELQSTYHHSSSISGTPDFIPASRYANPPSSSSSNQNIGDSYGGGRHTHNVTSSGMVPYRHHNSSTSQHQRPLSGPDISGQGGYPTSGSSRLNSSQTFTGSFSYATQQRNYENVSQQQGYGYPDRGVPTGGGYPRKQSTSFENEEPIPSNLTRVPRVGDPWASDSPGSSLNRSRSPTRFAEDSYAEMTVHLKRLENGFGFRIIGGTEEGSQVRYCLFEMSSFVLTQVRLVAPPAFRVTKHS